MKKARECLTAFFTGWEAKEGANGSKRTIQTTIQTNGRIPLQRSLSLQDIKKARHTREGNPKSTPGYLKTYTAIINDKQTNFSQGIRSRSPAH